MDSKEFIERRVWEYLDGVLTDEETREILSKIESDFEWRTVHEQAVALNKGMNQLQLEQPSLAFSSKVMKELASRKQDNRSMSALPAWIIALFFMGSIIYLLFEKIAALSSSGGDPQNTLSGARRGMMIIQHALLNENTFYFFIGINIILILALIDHLIRVRAYNNSHLV